MTLSCTITNEGKGYSLEVDIRNATTSMSLNDAVYRHQKKHWTHVAAALAFVEVCKAFRETKPKSPSTKRRWRRKCLALVKGEK